MTTNTFTTADLKPNFEQYKSSERMKLPRNYIQKFSVTWKIKPSKYIANNVWQSVAWEESEFYDFI